MLSDGKRYQLADIVLILYGYGGRYGKPSSKATRPGCSWRPGKGPRRNFASASNGRIEQAEEDWEEWTD
jgi:hypothetical protein